MIFKKILKRLIRGYRCDSKHYIDFLRKGGSKIGDNVVIFSPETFSCDIHNRHLLHIGNDVQITEYVTILTHDYSWSVIKGMTGEIIGNQNSVIVGNNVFIGMKSIILPGTNIGDNVVIGAGSVVKGIIESNSVYAGVPAKRIMSIFEFRKKRLEKQYEEAKNFAIEYFESFNKWPDQDKFHEYFFLFGNSTISGSVFDQKLKLMSNYDTSHFIYSTHIPKYKTFDDFLDSVKSDYYNSKK